MDKRDFEKIQNTIVGGLNKGLIFGLGDKNNKAFNYGEKITNELFKKIGERIIDQSANDKIANDIIANFGLIQLANNLAQKNLLNQIGEQDESPEIKKDDEKAETDLQKSESEEDTPEMEKENEDENEGAQETKPEPVLDPNELVDNPQNEPIKKNLIDGGKNVGNEPEAEDQNEVTPEQEDENDEPLPQNDNEANAKNEYNNKQRTPAKRKGKQARRGTENPEPTSPDLSVNQIDEQIEPDEPFEFVDENEIEKKPSMMSGVSEKETIDIEKEPEKNSMQKNFDDLEKKESFDGAGNDYDQFPTEDKNAADEEANPNLGTQENLTTSVNTQSQSEQERAAQLKKEQQTKKRDSISEAPTTGANQNGQAKPRQQKQLLQEVAEAKKKLQGPEKKINRIKKIRKIIRILAAICWLLGILLFWCGIGEIFMGFAVSLNGSSLWMKEMLVPLELQAKPLRKNLEEKRKKLAKALKEDKGKFRSGELSQRYNNYINRVSNSPNEA